MALEHTLSIVKPDVVRARQIGAVLTRLEAAGMSPVGQKMIHMTKAQAEGFYAEHRHRPFFAELVQMMTSGPVLVQVLEGEGAILLNRKVMGDTDPAQAAAGSIRADFGTSIGSNAVHGSDSPQAAAREVAFFFSAEEICSETRNN